MYTNYANCSVADGPVLIAALGSGEARLKFERADARDSHYRTTSN